MTKDELLDKLDEAQTNEEIREIGEKLLTQDSNSPYGKLAVWETTAYEDAVQSLDMLREALDGIRAIVDAKDSPCLIDEDRDALVYCTVMMSLGYSLLAEGEIEEAYEVAKEFANFDDEGSFPSRTLLYRCMLDLELYGDILKTLEADPLESVVGEHARAIALLETKAQTKEIIDSVNYAISLSPDVPFFITGIWDFPEPDEEMEDELDDVVNDATYLAEPWSKSDRRLAAISAPTFLLGYLTNRLSDDKELTILQEGYREAGVSDRVEAVKKRLEELDKAGTDPDEIDAEALGETAEILEELLGV